MTATERLRQLLDERGVEWRNRPYLKESITTIWKACGTEYHYRESRYGQTRLHADDLTPEQAVEATLGRGTCRVRGGECDQCGAYIHKSAVLFWVPVGEGMRTVESREVHFCPNCGRRVVNEQ